MRDVVAEGLRGECMGEFWKRLGEGSVYLQRCEFCGFVRYPPSPACPDCGAAGGEWISLGDRGVLRAWTVTRPAAAARLPRRLHAEVPYVLGAAGFAGLDGFLLPVRVIVDPPELLEVGITVRVGLDPDAPRRLIATPVRA